MTQEQKSFWIARNQDKSLFLHEKKPVAVANENIFGYWTSSGNILGLPEDSYPEITWENSPQLLKLQKDE